MWAVCSWQMIFLKARTCPLRRFFPRPSFLTDVVGQSQPSVGREGTNRVRWPVSEKPVSTKPFLRIMFLRTPVSRLTYKKTA